MNTSEHDHQKSVINWAEVKSGEYPELRLLYAIPNGGHRHKAVAAKLKAEGVKPGVPDLCLPVPRGTHHGLYIELKPQWHGIKRRRRPIPSDEQLWWLKELADQGFDTYCCHGAAAAITVIMSYLNQ